MRRDAADNRESDGPPGPSEFTNDEISVRSRRLIKHEGTLIPLGKDYPNSPGGRELQIGDYYMRDRGNGELFINYLGRGKWAVTIYSQLRPESSALTPYPEKLEHLVDVLRKRMILDDLADV